MEYLLRCKTLWYANEVLEPNATLETISLMEKYHSLKMDDNVFIKNEEEEDLTAESRFDFQNKIKVEPEDYFSTDVFSAEDEIYSEIKCDVTKSESQHQTDNDDDTSDKELYQCKDCNKSFTSKSGLWRHAKKHSAEEQTLYSCLVCEKAFTRKYGLLKHMETHTNVNKVEVKCPICKRPFDCQYNYERHMKSHTTKDPDANKCEHCGKTFSNKANLKTHMKRHMGKEKATATPATGGDATIQNMTEGEEKSFPCDGCDKTFKSKHYLKEHARIHLAKNPYQCILCEKQLSCKANLMVHMRTHVRKGTTGSEMKIEALMDLV